MPPSSPPDPAPDAEPKKRNVRTHTPRPDELSRETFEFIAAVDEYKRRRLRSFLEDAEILSILHGLGYARPRAAGQGAAADELADFAAARARYRQAKGRLFPTWSEVFHLLLELGYARADESSAA